MRLPFFAAGLGSILLACTSAPSSDASSSPSEGAGKDGASTPASNDPLDAIAEGEPVCTARGYCWESPYVPNDLRAMHAAATPDAPLWVVGSEGRILRSRSRGAKWLAMDVPTTKNLRGVFSLDRHHAWAVGEAGTVLAFDGASWKPVDAGLGETITLEGVWASGPSDVWVVGWESKTIEGSSGKVYETYGVLVHGDGATWTRDPSKLPALRAIVGASANDVWVGGGGVVGSGFDSSATLLSHFDGSTWSTETSPGSQGDVQSLWMKGPNDVFASTESPGSGVRQILHYEGERWTTEHSTEEASIGAFGRGPSGVPLVIRNTFSLDTGEAVASLLVRGDDATWSPLPDVALGAELAAVWTLEDDAPLVAGARGRLGRFDQATPAGAKNGQAMPEGHLTFTNGLFRYDAGTWTRLAAPSGQSFFLFGIGKAPTDVVLVGNDDLANYTRFSLWNGTQQTAFTAPLGHWEDPREIARTTKGETWFAETRTNIAFARRSATGAVLAVPTCGAGSRAHRMQSHGVAAIGDDVYGFGSSIDHVRPDGTCETIDIPTGNFALAESLVGSGPNDLMVLVYAEADATTHTLLHYDGSTLTKLASFTYPDPRATPVQLFALRRFANDDVYIVGKGATRHWNGKALETIDFGSSTRVDFVDAWLGTDRIRFVGEGGRVLAKR